MFVIYSLAWAIDLVQAFLFKAVNNYSFDFLDKYLILLQIINPQGLNMLKQAKFIVIHARKDIDAFMKAADLFNGKNLGTVEELVVNYDGDAELTLKIGKKTMEHIKKSLEKVNHLVSFVHLESVQNGDTIKLNEEVLPLLDYNAREISDGKKSFVMKDFIEAHTSFKCETDDCYYITSIK